MTEETMHHPGENDLALLAGGEAGRIRRFRLDRHVRTCADCRDKIAEYRQLRAELSDPGLPDLNWNFLAADMRANIRLGLEAGACVRTTQVLRPWNVRLGIAFASLALLVGSGFILRSMRFQSNQPNAALAEAAATTVLRSTGSEVEIRTGGRSLALLNHRGNAVNQTVSAQGDIGTRYVDGETGSVIINNVYLQY
jgi:hypothetical protein